VKIVRDKRRDWLALARDFGMTAASDARIPLEENDATEADPKAAKFRAFIGA
jgi:phage terminase small subunit